MRAQRQSGADRHTHARRLSADHALLASAWLLVLACCGGIVGWLAYADAPPHPPVITATLHTGDLPAPSPPKADLVDEEVSPWTLHLAAQDILTSSPDGPEATNDADAEPETPADTAEISTPPISDLQVAARTDDAQGTDAANSSSAPPLPPAVPQSDAPRVIETTEAGRYSVQVGAFREIENAIARAQQLSQAGYDVRIVHAFATRSRLYMVRLGQFDARPAAMAYARQLAQDVKVETWPVRN
ncbi:SPOR domain-containing protein [Rhodovibrio salinarum]|nr:SPOR domain-containing protein [Rhodovibrio salinarum]